MNLAIIHTHEEEDNSVGVVLLFTKKKRITLGNEDFRNHNDDNAKIIRSNFGINIFTVKNLN